MKKLLAILLCALAATGAADARTLYVNASRPNNNGNGLKPATAKRTIQAAVNIAQNGDTILVYPGWYSPVKTNGKKITIKSLYGASKTGITCSRGVLASLGKGKNSALTGFLLDGRVDRWDGNLIGRAPTGGVEGGTLSACCLQRIYGSGTLSLAVNATLTGCTLRNNRSAVIGSNILARCKITDNNYCETVLNRLCNCLVSGNRDLLFGGCVFVNCTIAKNGTLYDAKGKPVLACKSKFYNCILRNNYRQTETWSNGDWVYGKPVIHNVDAAVYGNTYFRTYTNNRDPKFVNYAKGDYRLAKGSPCIDLGQLNATLKQLVGSYDLSGKKRIRGKAIDMGCYEY